MPANQRSSKLKFSESPEKLRRTSTSSSKSWEDNPDDPQVKQLREAIEHCKVGGGKLPPPPASSSSSSSASASSSKPAPVAVPQEDQGTVTVFDTSDEVKITIIREGDCETVYEVSLKPVLKVEELKTAIVAETGGIVRRESME